MLNVDHIEIAKFNKYNQDWWDEKGSFAPLHQINPLRVNWINNYTKLKGKKICDIGCGGGLLSEAMAKLGGEVTGIDVSYNAIKIAKKHATLSKLKINYQCIPVEDLSKNHSSIFDIVTCLEILEHVPQPEIIIKLAGNLAKKGGFIFFSTINRNLTAYVKSVLAAEYLFNFLPKGTHNYEYFIRPSELTTAVRNAGLFPVEFKGIEYSLLKRRFNLSEDVTTNYLLACRKR